MGEFLQNYGLFIFIGLFFALMFWRQARGSGGCCGGEHQHETVKKDDQTGTRTGGCH